MTEFKIVEILARRFNNGREECQVQWAVTWEVVDKAFARQQLYQEFMEDLKQEQRVSGNTKHHYESSKADYLTELAVKAKGDDDGSETEKIEMPTTKASIGETETPTTKASIGEKRSDDDATRRITRSRRE